jgi:hypothetical protein
MEVPKLDDDLPERPGTVVTVDARVDGDCERVDSMFRSFGARLEHRHIVVENVCGSEDMAA